MELLISTPVYPPEIGGPAIYARSLAEYLSARGHRIAVLTFGPADRVESDGSWSVERVGRCSLLRRYRRYARRLRARLDDAQGLYCLDHLAAPAVAAARRSGKPLALRIMVDPAWELATRFGWSRLAPDAFRAARRGLRAGLVRRLQLGWWRRADLVIVPSEYLGGMMRDYGFAAEGITRVNNPYHGAVTPTREAAASERGRRLLAVARLVAWKRIAEVVEEFAAFGSSWELRIVGEGPERERIRAIVRQRGLLGRVVLMGRLSHDEVLEQMRRARALVSLSRYEGLSHTILEAMAQGLAVAATDVGGNRELLAGGRCGLLLQPEGPWNLAKILPAWLREGARECAVAAREFVLRHYSREQLFARLERELEAVVDG